MSLCTSCHFLQASKRPIFEVLKNDVRFFGYAAFVILFEGEGNKTH